MRRRSERLDKPLDSIHEVLCNDPTKELIAILKKESEEQAQRDAQLFQLIIMQAVGHEAGSSGMTMT